MNPLIEPPLIPVSFCSQRLYHESELSIQTIRKKDSEAMVWTNSGTTVLRGVAQLPLGLGEDFAACSFTNRDHARMPDLPFCGNRIEMTNYVLCDPDSLDVIVLPKMVLQCAWNWKDSGS